MEQEAVLLALLPSVSSYSIEGTKLTLKNATGQIAMELVAY